MTLTAHAVVGAAAARLVPAHPVLGFFLGFISHYVLDSIPHGHYPIKSHTRNPENRLAEDMVFGRAFFFDLLKIAFDFALGFALVYFFFGQQFKIAAFFGAWGGVLPDALQFAYWKTRVQPFIALQKLHLFAHAKKNLNGRLFLAFALEFCMLILAFYLSH